MKNNLPLIILFIVILAISGAILFLIIQKQTAPTTEQVVENAFRNTLAKDSEGNLIVSSGKTYILTTPEEFRYQILYQEPQNLFRVEVLDWRFEEARKEGEQKLLQLTELNESEACKVLNAEVSTPSFVNPELAGQIFPLSFCK